MDTQDQAVAVLRQPDQRAADQRGFGEVEAFRPVGGEHTAQPTVRGLLVEAG